MADSSSSRPSKRRRKSPRYNIEAVTHGNDTSSSAPVSSEKKLSPVFVFAHGAGAPSSSDWMLRWKEMLGKALNAVEVVTSDYPCKKRAPPKAEKLVEFHSDLVKRTVAKYPGHPLILDGKSMGSWVAKTGCARWRG